jgi:hypothetical protein
MVRLINSQTTTGTTEMHTKLKQAVIQFIFDNLNEFQLVNATVAHFRPYIYDSKGEYLIGGKEVAGFIVNAARLIAS